MLAILRSSLTACVLAGLASVSLAQSPNTEHTLKLDGSVSPPATIDSLAWLAGSWEGEAFGGRFEEVWSPPSAGTMVGTFMLVHNDKPSMFEFVRIIEAEGSLVVQLKHFNADFSGWEAKDEHVSFPLVKLTEQAVYFGGLTYIRKGPDQMQVYVATSQDGEVHEEALLFRRAEGGS